MLNLQPISFREAQRFIAEHHRHNVPVQGHKFSLAVNDGGKLVGVATVGRPIARFRDDGWTAEVTRVCVLEGYRNANSMLYAAAWRAARAMGYRRLISYILQTEPGTSLKAAGWKEVGAAGGGTWTRPSRPRVDTHPIEQKVLWEAV